MEALLFDGHKVQISDATVSTWRQGPHGIQAHDIFLIEFFFKKLREKNSPVVFDVGAHTGMFSLLSLYIPGSVFYSFEPAPRTYEMLVENLTLNNAQRVYPFNVALSNFQGQSELKIPRDLRELGLSVLGTPKRFDSWETSVVGVTTLDGFIEGKPEITSVDFIKIDTEGCELLVLQGAEKFIRKNYPDILLEYFSPNTHQFGYEKEEILKLLSSWGYEMIWSGAEDAYFRRSKRI